MDKKKLCHDADTVLELLYNTYYEHVCTDDTDEIKQAIATTNSPTASPKS